MKFNRRDIHCYIAHFKCLASMLLVYIFSLKWLRNNKTEKTVMMYSHALSGNIKAFFDYTLENSDLPYETYYATIDKREYKEFAEAYGDKVLLATRFSALRKILSSGIMMTSHGPGIFYLLKWLAPKTKFIDVWHGIPFKIFNIGTWKLMRFYTAIFVSSEYFRKKMYHEKYKFDINQLFVTGYARVDRFCNPETAAKSVRKKFNLQNAKHIILFAPTWRPGSETGEIPFGMNTTDFVELLNDICKRLDAVLIFRTHINSSLNKIEVHYSNIEFISQSDYPDTNDLLTATDVLVTDWSSIAIDFYALCRPIIFVKMPRPSNYISEKSFVDRIGSHVSNIKELSEAIASSLNQDKAETQKKLAAAVEKCYGNTLDGKNCARYDGKLRKLLKI